MLPMVGYSIRQVEKVVVDKVGCLPAKRQQTTFFYVFEFYTYSGTIIFSLSNDVYK